MTEIELAKIQEIAWIFDCLLGEECGFRGHLLTTRLGNFQITCNFNVFENIKGSLNKYLASVMSMWLNESGIWK